MLRSTARTRLHLLSATLLSAGWALLPNAANAQAYCTVSDGSCTFPSVNEPLVHTFQGASGSDSTPGGSGPDVTFVAPGNLNFGLPYNSAYQGIYIKQLGGDGSYSGPSVGGNGGNLALTPPASVTVTLTEDLDISDAAAGILMWTEGGPGTDNNENNNSDGAAGGSGGSINSIGAGTNVSLLGSFANLSNSNDLIGVELRSYGGQGGRLNAGVEADYDGGAGGVAGDIDWTSGSVTVGSTTIPLVADTIAGIRARSVGGSGPNDYNSHDNSNDGGGGYSLGGNAGEISITSGAVSVAGRTNNTGGTFGIYAHSLGGVGGYAYSVGVSPFIENGGPGGFGEKVTINADGTITVVDTGTSAAPGGSAAILARSTGGAGGTGQSNKTGGAGASGGEVYVNVNPGAGISATGINVDAIVARSEGGQGGAGLANANVSTGGKGGSGGDVNVIVNLANDVKIASNASPAGQNSGRGIVAQSLSALGGIGSEGNEFGGRPGEGGAGGNGGAVSVNVMGGTLTTDGTNDLGSGLDFANGIQAQSIGGGGGDGGAFSNFLRSSGGSGGSGGTGGTVDVTSYGVIETSGAQANGILAQSIGGGGGAGGAATSAVIALGGSGGSGGDGGDVTVTNGGTISTNGYNASGILAQSISGGGGAAGVSGAAISIGATGGVDTNVTAGTVTVANTGAITTVGDAAAGILAQSVGGGGGSAAGDAGPDDSSSTGVLAIGSAGGGAGPGGAVDVTDLGTLSTTGEFAPGLQAQSIGGGGGAGGNVFAVGVLSASGSALGGQGGGGGDGGGVTVSNTKNVAVTTNGQSSAGLLMQSIGGGGGSGGNAQTDDIGTVYQLAVGGAGGGAGNGGAVGATLSNSAIETRQSISAGVVAQSVGGGGGSGGSATAKAASFLNFGFTAGGSGGDGGNGGSATVDVSNSSIATATGLDTSVANDAVGILAQSIGGGGGTGGVAASSAITTGVPFDPDDPDQSISVNAQFALGGRAANGGNGGTASATLSDQSSVATNGAGSHGILVQSIGGGGGSGGDASTATTVVPDTTQQYSLTINAALGGAGGNGGNGGSATATVGSSSPAASPSVVSTTGEYANGVVVQSIGGGGGNSGLPTSNAKTILGQGTVGITFDLGSGGIIQNGETGAAGGTTDVTLYDDSRITTTGSGARGVVAQSIGGGGGTVQGGEIQLNANFQGGGDGEGEEAAEDDDSTSYTGTVTVGLGMSGGQGGDGGVVDVRVNPGSVISTAGIDADGILAQSIGGGGGLAGNLGSGSGDSSASQSVSAAADDDDDDDDVDVTLDVSVGGKGGTGGSGSTVNLNFGGQVTTTGDWADGIVAQSIGGGGGAGGASMSSGSSETANINIGVGGSGGTAGNGGAISASFNDNSPGNFVHTSGFMAHGVVLQSIGGGGGQGGDGSEMADGKITVGAAAGGSGGTPGNGNTITIGPDGSWINIVTKGDDAHGFVAQSIGGGGGIGGAGSQSAQDDDDGHSVDITVGGQGGPGGMGAALDLEFGTSIKTSGNRAFGIVAQSIGGGGGIGGVGTSSGIASVNVGGRGGAGGPGGNVGLTLTEKSNITTAGVGAHGIIAQSIGGGGGIGGDLSVGPFDLTPGSSSSEGGVGEAVDVTVDGTITTTGAMSHGIIAQSIGGGGGLGGSSAGAFAGSTSNGVGEAYGSGNVTVTTTGAISATGENSIGILAQSMGGANTTSELGNVTVDVSADVTGGSGEGAGIVVASGLSNEVNITNGATVSAASGTAIHYTGSGTTTGGSTTDVLVGRGSTVIGDIILENADGRIAGTVTNNSQNSLRGASLYAANVVNNGRLVIGDAGPGDRLRITGDFEQTRAGRIDAAVDFARLGRSDRMRVDGDARLNGTVAVSANALLADREVDFLRVYGNLTGTIAAMDTRAVDYDARIVGNRVRVSVADTRFAEAFDGLGEIERSVGEHLDAIFDNRSRRYATLLARMNDFAEQSNDDGVAYAAALYSLSPAATQAIAASQVSLSKGRLDGALRCPVGTGTASTPGEDGCVWANGAASYADQSGRNGYDGSIFGFAGGAQFSFDENWIAGIAAGYDHSSYDGNDGSSSVDGDTGFLAVALGRRFGDFTLSGALAGSYGTFDTTRRIAVPGFAGKATADSDLGTISARIRAAYTMANAVGYVTPILDIDLVHTRAGGYTEKGAGIFNLDVNSSSATALVVTPSVEVGTSRPLEGGWSLAASAIAGVSFSTEDDWSTSASLVAAPAGVGDFSTSVPIADVVGRIGLGVSLANADSGFDVKAEYNGAFGNDYQSHGGMLRFTKRF